VALGPAVLVANCEFARDRLLLVRIAAIVDHEEFVIRAHTDYLAATIAGAKLIILPNVSHFAPWQDPQHLTSQSCNFSTIDPVNCGSPEIR
jgi:hypothetical protein